MCFSAEASFIVGGALVPAGVYCIYAASVKRPSYLGLAAVPLCFGIQQISEGFVWHALDHGDSTQARAPALVFLFFALAFWPWWFSLATTLMEPVRWRRWALVGLAVLTTVWFWILYYPLLMGPESLLKIQIAEGHHSVQYMYKNLAVYDYIDKATLRVFYFLSVAMPPLVGSENWGRIPGAVLGASAILAAMLYDYAFVSVWCFFAAVLASYCCVLFYRLPSAPQRPSARAS